LAAAGAFRAGAQEIKTTLANLHYCAMARDYSTADSSGSIVHLPRFGEKNSRPLNSAAKEGEMKANALDYS